MPRKADKVNPPDAGKVRKGNGIRRALRNLGLIGDGPRGGRTTAAEDANNAGKFDKKAR